MSKNKWRGEGGATKYFTTSVVSQSNEHFLMSLLLYLQQHGSDIYLQSLLPQQFNKHGKLYSMTRRIYMFAFHTFCFNIYRNYKMYSCCIVSVESE